jgi:hypothetical protein
VTTRDVVIYLSSMLYLSYGEIFLGNYGLWSILLYFYYRLIFTRIIYILVNYYLLSHYMFNPLFTANR